MSFIIEHGIQSCFQIVCVNVLGDSGPSPWEIDITEWKESWVAGSIQLSDGHFYLFRCILCCWRRWWWCLRRQFSARAIRIWFWAHGQSRGKQKEDCKRKKIAQKKKGTVKKGRKKRKTKQNKSKKEKKVECKFWMALSLTGLRTTPLPYCLFHSSAGLKKWSKINRSKFCSQASLIFNCTDLVRVNFALPA